MADDEDEEGDEAEFWEKPADFWAFWKHAWKRALGGTWKVTNLPDRKADALVFLVVVLIAGIALWIAWPDMTPNPWAGFVSFAGPLVFGAVAGAFVLAGREAHRMHEEAASAAREAWCSTDGPPRLDLLPRIAHLHQWADTLAHQAYRNDYDSVKQILALCEDAEKFFKENGEAGCAAVVKSKAALVLGARNSGLYPECKLAYEAADEARSQLFSMRSEIDEAIAREAERLDRKA